MVSGFIRRIVWASETPIATAMVLIFIRVLSLELNGSLSGLVRSTWAILKTAAAQTAPMSKGTLQ